MAAQRFPVDAGAPGDYNRLHTDEVDDSSGAENIVDYRAALQKEVSA
jgi:hypothetical protein